MVISKNNDLIAKQDISEYLQAESSNKLTVIYKENEVKLNIDGEIVLETNLSISPGTAPKVGIYFGSTREEKPIITYDDFTLLEL